MAGEGCGAGVGSSSEALPHAIKACAAITEMPKTALSAIGPLLDQVREIGLPPTL